MNAKIIFVVLCLFLLFSCSGGQTMDDSSMQQEKQMSQYPEPPMEEPPAHSPYEQTEPTG